MRGLGTELHLFKKYFDRPMSSGKASLTIHVGRYVWHQLQFTFLYIRKELNTILIGMASLIVHIGITPMAYIAMS